MKITRTIKTYEDLVQVFKQLKSEGFDNPHVLTYKEGTEKRRDAQNRLYYHWLGEIAQQSENGPKYERGYYKWTYGCPIVARDDEWFKENVYEKLMETYTYEEVIDVMGEEVIQVSSLMGIKQMSQYIEDMKSDANRRGFVLTDLDDIYYQHVLNEKG